MLALPVAALAQPANDHCTNATVIPGNTVHYNPANLIVSAAGVLACPPAHSCASGTVGKDVYYRYTPDLDGVITVDTLGSNYDTVVSAFANCRGLCGLGCCATPIEYACNDDFFLSDQSQMSMPVEAGTTYTFRVSAINAAGGEVLNFDLYWQPPNDACASAEAINGMIYSSPVYSTVNAVIDNCEAQESCELNNVGISNTVWYSYTPSCDGLLTIDTAGSSYDTVLSVFDGCGVFYGVDIPCGIPTEIACDDDGGPGVQSLIAALPVSGGVEYLIKVADYNTSQGGGLLQFNLSFKGDTPPIAAITTPLAYDCACSATPVIGTADQTAGDFAGYVLDYMLVGHSGWTEIFNGLDPVVDDQLGLWNTVALAEGNYLLRLTVMNGCGQSASAVQFVYVDDAFSSLELAGLGGVVGGKICPIGTAWDTCFEEYAVEYAPSGSGSYQPVIAAQPVYTSTVTNNPLLPTVQWNTLAPAVPDGDYDLRLTGVTRCGEVSQQTVQITIDNTAPEAFIDFPTGCSVVDGEVEVIGTASDANLAKWTLQYTGGGATGWVTVDSGDVSVFNDVLGYWDTSSLEACAYLLRLLVSDAASIDCNGAVHHVSEYTVAVLLGDCGDFDSDNDGDVDLVDYAAFLQEFTGPLP